MLKGLLIDTEKNEFRIVEIEAKLDEYYKVLGCDLIDIVSRKFSDGY